MPDDVPAVLTKIRTFRYLALPLAAVALVSGIEWLADAEPGTLASTANAASWERSGFGPPSYAEAEEYFASQIDLGEERVRKGEAQWLRHESLARAHLARSHLAYTYQDLILAGESLALAKRLAPAGSGPLLTDAVYAQMTHQLGRTEQALSQIDRWAVQTDPAILAESASLRGDIAFYRGDPATAGRNYDEAAAYGENAGVAYRQAALAKSSGDFSAAIQYFTRSNPQPDISTPFVNANTALQIGAVELARGDYSAAMGWFATADRLFPGYWRIEAHLAQARALGGELPEAIADMQEIARRAPAPEVMDALAMLLRADGRAEESRRWARRAGAIWDDRLRQLPAATYGHALEHELVFGSPDRALELARLNLAARPYGESRIMLASALLANGMSDEAIDQLALAERSGWRSASLYALRSRALELTGKPDEAQGARASAISLNPRIFEPETSLVWLSHG